MLEVNLRASLRLIFRLGMWLIATSRCSLTGGRLNCNVRFGRWYAALYKLILERPSEELDPDEGGLCFSGSTPWGNRVATEKEDVQNVLIDACKLYLTEFHVDGFRFDATNTNYMDRDFRLRLADELKRFKPSVLLVAENLPNQPDLNRAGYDGLAQWCDPFHDKMKAMLREGVFQDSNFYSPDGLGISSSLAAIRSRLIPTMS